MQWGDRNFNLESDIRIQWREKKIKKCIYDVFRSKYILFLYLYLNTFLKSIEYLYLNTFWGVVFVFIFKYKKVFIYNTAFDNSDE